MKSDLDKTLDKRFKGKPKKKHTFLEGYEKFKIGVLLKEARKEAGMTQLEVAKKLKKSKELISRLENHIDNPQLSTIIEYATAIGKKVHITIE